MDLTSAIPIEIHLQTKVAQEGETTQHVFDEPGQLVQIGETLYFRYSEVDPDTGAKTPVMIKVMPNGDVQLSRLSRQDGINLKLFFSLGNRMIARYQTPYGVIPVETVTPKLHFRIKDRPVSGELYIEYQLFAGKQHIGNYQLQLLFTA
ncbi:DUF1934 domain-containing protein [Lactobacillus sp. CC-MHH1034]|uniref:DUF1934 domain-containing protein n=1 Tax=Agrilactobacillus fermenti TaxID=2586909 RepID=UPI001E392A63|nr:DUF1934 domain-containing protein [Agrilactobacillus fermenti]MCD2255969.1 DUF1934 domain-containing protein [Agrilactobacillus fermenti]